jgi:hypothetical protein
MALPENVRDDLIATALDAMRHDVELAEACKIHRLDLEDVTRAVRERQDAIWNNVTDAERKYLAASAASATAHQALYRRRQQGRLMALRATVVVLSAGLAALIVQGAAAFASGKQLWIEALAEEFTAPGAFFALLSCAQLIAMAARARERGIETAEHELRTAELHAEAAREYESLVSALARATLREAREVVGQAAGPADPRRLEVSAIPGLAELNVTEFDIETASHREALALLRTMRAGTIGLAGPRGVGKTTLLRELATGQPDALGIVVAAPVRYDAKEFFIYLFERVCEAVVGGVVDADVLAGSRRGGTMSKVRDAWMDELRHRVGRPSRPPAPENADARVETYRVLEELLFQKSYVAGLGGEFGPPRVAKISGKRESQWTRLPWSFPQLVHAFRSHLETLAATQRVVIAIDELDTIADPAAASAFLSDLKAIFGMPNVFFVVSVSDDAMITFERRGQPVSDTVGSVFDHVLTLRPLTYGEVERLLRRRVIGMPWPFVALTAAFGGGLPREVIRVARQCVLISRDRCPAFDAVLGGLVEADLSAGARAAIYALSRRQTEMGVAEAVEWLASLAGQPTTDRIRELHAAAEPVVTSLRAADASRGSSTAAALDIVEEMRGRLSFALTALEVFGQDELEYLHNAISDGLIDGLGEARAAASLGPASAGAAIARVRAAAALA